MTISEYINNYKFNNKNGIWAREEYLKLNYPAIYSIIIDYNSHINISFTERVYQFIWEIKETPKCPSCSKPVKFKNRSIGYQKACSNRCSSQLNSYKVKETLLKTHGVTHQSHILENKLKLQDKKIERIKSNIQAGVLLKYDNDVLHIKCDKCSEIHEIEYKVWTQRVQLNLDWRDCITGYNNGSSNGELEVLEFIKNNYTGEIIINDRKILSGKEVDIWLPQLNIAIEFNGLYWHCEVFKSKDYHHNKWRDLNNLGIQLIQIWEDEWINKKAIVKSRLLNLLGKSNKIWARKCELKEVPSRDANLFLKQNHLQGPVNSSIRYGLYYSGELISLMTFGKPRKGLRYKSDTTNIYELYRFCNKLGITVIGGASRLFKHFIKSNRVDEVFSYSALEWPGKLYTNLGMNLVDISNHSFWYIGNHKRVSRHTYNKQNLIKMGFDKNKTADQIIKELKIHKIWGPGNKRYVLKFI